MGLLGAIANGSLKIGKKIYTGIKERKEKKVEKKAEQLLKAQQDAANIGLKLEGTGLISGSGNIINQIKGLINPSSGAVAVANQNAPQPQGENPIVYIVGGIVAVFVLFKLMNGK